MTVIKQLFHFDALKRKSTGKLLQQWSGGLVTQNEPLAKVFPEGKGKPYGGKMISLKTYRIHRVQKPINHL